MATRGELRIYLGAAPGVGKTYAMLDEAQRRAARGTDTIIGMVETHGRSLTARQIGDLEVIPRRRMTYRGAEFEDLDLDAILARKPTLVCIDELAHTNVPGMRNDKRWRDVDLLLAAGINVLSTVNVQHLESVNDVVEKITDVKQRETVPDAFVRAADQVELVDLTPEALRRRMAHGNIYPAERVDAALSNYFRVGNLTALREIALLWLADKVDDALLEYRREHDIDSSWETRERVVVALTGGPEGETLIRRAARIANRGGADLLALHVSKTDGLTGASPADLAQQRRLVEDLGGSFHLVIGERIADALIDFARAENATQLVIGASRRGGVTSLLSGPGIGSTTVRLSGDIDVHMVTHDEVGRGRGLPRLGGGLTPRRQVAGLLLAGAGLPLLTLLLASLRPQLNLPSDLLAYLVAVVAVSLVGGLYPSLVAAIAASALLNYYFTPPLHRWTIASHNNVIAIAGFGLVAIAVSAVVDASARRAVQAARATAESHTLATLAGTELRGQIRVDDVLRRLREALRLDGVSVLRRVDGGWDVLAVDGDDPPGHDDGQIFTTPDDDIMLVVRGPFLQTADHRIISVFAAHAAAMVERQRLADAAAAAEPIAAADRMRTALLTAVSHDLRSPLASATAAVDSLRATELVWSRDQHDELLATAAESLERLARLVENLLDMSRLQAGALAVFPVPCRLDEMVAVSLDAIGAPVAAVVVEIADTLPEALADPSLLERVIANVVSNSLRFSPAGTPAILTGSSHGRSVELRVIDRGPGVDPRQFDQIFTPFQRLGDNDNTTGIGLGLALSRGLVEAMGGQLEPEETPGGGLTMIVRLPQAC